MNNGTIEARFNDADSHRSSALNRARDYSELSIPSILPVEGHTEESELVVPYQSLASRGVLNLASRIGLALMPANQSFFKFKPQPSGDDNADEEKELSKQERIVLNQIDSTNLRQAVATALQHLIITGNAALYLNTEYSGRVYRMDQYTVRRTPAGRVFEVILKDTVDVATLSPEVVDKLPQFAGKDLYQMKLHERLVDMYTQWLKPGKDMEWEVRQEIQQILLYDEPDYYKHSRVITPVWNHIAGENYGRGHIEDHIGDIRSYEGISKALLEGAAILSKINIMVNPNSPYTNKQQLVDSENGDILDGREEDIYVLTADRKSNDMQIAFQYAQQIAERLGFAFLMNSAVQPDGERVTATQIRTLAEEIEGVLGGIYTSLAENFQKPLLEAIVDQMQEQDILEIPDDVDVSIVTGFEALGREQELVKYQTLIQLFSVLGEETISYLYQDELFKRVLVSLQVPDPDALVRTREEVDQMNQQKMMQETMSQMAVKGAGQAPPPEQPQ